MIIVFGVLALIPAVLIAGGIAKAVHHMRKYGILLVAFWWFTGHTLHGHYVTDAGWFREGAKAIHHAGYAPRFYYLPRWKRAVYRTGGTFAVLLVVYGSYVTPRATVTTLAVLAGTALVLGAVFGTRSFLRRKTYRTWVRPLHSAISPLVDIPLPTSKNWIQVAPDHSRVVMELPGNFNESERKREKIAELVAAKTGMEQPEVIWSLAGEHPKLVLLKSSPPPIAVGLSDIREAIEKSSNEALILGLGKKSAPVAVSLHTDSPHVGASMGSGGGKSTLARLITAQMLHKGCIALILDVKMISHPWARQLPNVAYADTIEVIHDALVWLAGELDRRNRVAKIAADVEGDVRANVGPRLIVAAEELNMLVTRLKDYWQNELGGKGKSPAIAGLEEISFAGRQVRMNLVTIGQMLTARSVGSGESRESIGVRILARYTKKNWDMLVPEHPMPPSNDIMGRVQVASSGQVRETQIAFMSGQEARDFSLSGDVALLPAGMPGGQYPRIEENIPAFVGTLQIENDSQQEDNHDDLQIDADASNAELPPVTLLEAIRAGILKGSISVARNNRMRDPAFPKPLPELPDGGNKLAHYYNPLDLAEYQKSKDAAKGKKS